MASVDPARARLSTGARLVIETAEAHIQAMNDQAHTEGPQMTTRNKVMDDISQLMTNAMGVAQGARQEAETAVSSMVDRWLADRDFVTREEFDAVRAMAQKAREENAALSARLDALEGGNKSDTVERR
jgi:BMFP domain-containing protein YqiC